MFRFGEYLTKYKEHFFFLLLRNVCSTFSFATVSLHLKHLNIKINKIHKIAVNTPFLSYGLRYMFQSDRATFIKHVHTQKYATGFSHLSIYA
jgi:hypothetical protein